MKNNTQRKEWLADYRSWGVWYADKHIGAVYYKYDFDNGAKLIVEEYEDTLTTLRKAEKCISRYYHLVGGPEPVRRTDGSPKWSRHENYTKYPDSESELVGVFERYTEINLYVAVIYYRICHWSIERGSGTPPEPERRLHESKRNAGNHD